jgi:hypothetical protein
MVSMEPEVRVRTIRRRRTVPEVPQSPPPNVRNWAIYTAVGAVVVALMLDGYLNHRPQHAALPSVSQATEVRSTVSQDGDSLQVVVSWDLTLAAPAGVPDSIRVKVVRQQPAESLIAIQQASQLADTLYLPLPAVGQTVQAVSCVTAEHQGGMPDESCTPWQYVRPSAAAQAVAATQIVVQPGGLQVDPDVGGRCAYWQQTHPGQSVWVAVNQTAVPACTGPNAKPTVAQFCAFAILPGGRRVKTTNSSNNDYCDELFEEWARERIS